MLRGVIPPRWIRRTQTRISPHSIGWEYCNILEPDPQRRLRLNISNRLLEEMHPADLADIVEELAPDDREAIFEAIDSEVAADTLSEVDPDIQASILESLETEKAADILEEMEPHDAADVLNELEEETSEEILEEMEPEEKTEVEGLLEFDEDSAGGLMSRDYVALPDRVSVADALERSAFKRRAAGNPEHSVSGGRSRQAEGRGRSGEVVHLLRPRCPLKALAMEPLISVPEDETKDRITELFDKYNLLDAAGGGRAGPPFRRHHRRRNHLPC